MAVFVVDGGSQLRLHRRGSGAATTVGTLFLAGHEVQIDQRKGDAMRTRDVYPGAG